MTREIKIIKRGVRDLGEVEREKELAPARTEAEVASPLKLAKTIEGWVRIHRQRTTEQLSAARAFRTALANPR